MNIKPQTVLENYKNKRIDKSTVTKLLTSIIEKNDEENSRIEAISILNTLKIKTRKLFEFFENFLLSDSSEDIRNAAAKYISTNFLEISLPVFRWVIQKETSYSCMITVINSLVKIHTNESKSILFEHIKNIRNIKYLNVDKGFENKNYRKALKLYFKKKSIKELSHKHLAAILINFLTIKILIKDIPNIYFELNEDTLLIEKLDLSDYLEFEVKGTPWEWRNNIHTLSQLNGLSNLKHLKTLDLSNNQIRNLEGLVELKNLTHLVLPNNQISDLKNLEYINQLSKLQFLDLCGNDISENVKNEDFNPYCRVLLNRYI
ncbi:MAG: leucine-rich repeat protein [Candidatus Lokiarchaeota archaeon]|nr:leucine-rich repeat protein [Candidatus Lokiarchaeota archaeon]